MDVIQLSSLWSSAPPDNIDYPDSNDDDVSISGSEQDDNNPDAWPLQQHRQNHLARLQQLLGGFTIDSLTSDQPNRRVIVSPPASKMLYTITDPVIYRRLQPAQSIVDLAQHLGLDDEEVNVFQKIDDEDMIVTALVDLFNAPDREYLIENLFVLLIRTIAGTYHLHVTLAEKIRYSVGGLLADPDLAVCGITDNCFLTHSVANRFILSTEAKTKRTFQHHRLWYKRSRAIQSIAALRASSAPTLLYNQERFKLFYVFKGALYSYPAGYDTGGVRSKEFMLMLAYILKAGNKTSPAPAFKKPSFLTPIKDKKKRPMEKPSAEKPSQESGKRTRSSTGSIRKINYSGMQDVECVRLDSFWSVPVPDGVVFPRNSPEPEDSSDDSDC